MGRKPKRKIVSPRKEMPYKADRVDELAPHSEVPGSVREVNGGVVQLEFAFLSGEACATGARDSGSAVGGNVGGDRAGVSRGHSTVEASAERPEPERCAATPVVGRAAESPCGQAGTVLPADHQHRWRAPRGYNVLT